jgi:predicted amidohydrolase
VFQTLSDTHGVTIGVGMPTRSASGIHISMICFQPSQLRQCYSKQQLHDDEKPFFVEGNGQVLLRVGSQVITPGICYESLQPNHAENAVRFGSTIYVASVAKSRNGIIKGDAHYPSVASSYSIPVLLSNCVGFCDNFMSVGESAVWTKDGRLAARLTHNEEGMLIYDTDDENVIHAPL